MRSLVLAFLLGLPLFADAGQFVRVTAWEVVGMLLRDGVLVCFECVHNEKSDAVTLKAQIEKIERIPAKARTQREEGLLESMLRLRKEGTGDDVVVNWKQKEFDFMYPDAPVPPEKILDALILADPDYRWEKMGTRYLVYPEGKSFDCPIPGFSAQDKKFWDFVQAAEDQILKPAKLNSVFVGVGRPWTDDYQEKVFSLTLGPSGSREALTAFCEAIGSNIVWHVQGCEPDWLNVGLSPVSAH